MSSRGISSVGRAIGSQSIGQGFESPILQEKQKPSIRAAFVFTMRRIGDSIVSPKRAGAASAEGGPEAEGRRANPLFSTIKKVVRQGDLFYCEGNSQRSFERSNRNSVPKGHAARKPRELPFYFDKKENSLIQLSPHMDMM